MFNFAHKAFVKMVSSRRGGGAASAATSSLDQLQGTDGGADHEKSGSSGGKNKRGKKKRKDKTMTTATAAATATGGVAAAGTGSGAGQDGEGGANDDDDTRHLSVAFLCSFMEAGAFTTVFGVALRFLSFFFACFFFLFSVWLCFLSGQSRPEKHIQKLTACDFFLL